MMSIYLFYGSRTAVNHDPNVLEHGPLILKATIKEILEDITFWEKLKSSHTYLKHIAICTAYLEGDMTPISAVYGVIPLLDFYYAFKYYLIE